MLSRAVRGETVLVVDDQPETLRFITDTLEHAGLNVLVATSGHSALTLLDHSVSRLAGLDPVLVPDLVLMDAMMPDMDGFATTQAIKANPATSALPVIFMTGLADDAHVIEGFAAGCADYVRKPVNVDELLARVRLHLGQARAARASAASLDATGRLMLAVGAGGTLLWCTPLAEHAIARFAPAHRAPAGTDWTRWREHAAGHGGRRARTDADCAPPRKRGPDPAD